jgi:tetratricopeptide (TPR) repeat protein
MKSNGQPLTRETGTSSGEREAWITLLVFALACLPFLKAVTFGFVAWDDDIGIENNLAWRGIGPEQLHWMFTTFTLGHWQPLAWLSFGIEHTLWGVDPERMHALNVLLHGLNAALFYLLAVRLLGPAVPVLAPVFAALFFAVHPLRVEAAAWITERAHLLSTSFALGSVLAWMKSTAAAGSRRWRFVSFALFALSLMTKAWGISLPFVLVILDVGWKRVNSGSERFTTLALQQLRDKAAFFLLAIAAVAIELVAKTGNGEFASFAQHGLVARVSQAGLVVFLCFARTLWPVGLSPLYEFRPGLELTGAIAFFGALALTVVLYLGRQRFRAALCIWLACLALLAPVSGIAQWGLQQSADRYTYLAAMPLSLFAGAGLARATALTSSSIVRWSCRALAGVILFTAAFASARQVEVWRDSKTLWDRVVEMDPSSFIGWHNVSITLHRSGQPREAANAERKSVQLEPGIRNRDSWFHLGQLEWLCGDRERAAQAWRTALTLDPADLVYLDWLASTQPSQAQRRALWQLASEAAPDNQRVASRLSGSQ